MISVIVCSKKTSSDTQHRDHCAITIGCEHEYIRIDNTRNEYGLSAAYNKGAAQAQGTLCVFVHEDVFFITPHWGTVLENKFNNDETIGCVGVAGTQYLFRDNPFWVKAGKPFVKGKVVHEGATPNNGILTVFSEDDTDTEAVVVDGLFFAIRKSLFSKICFDEETFDRFHFYDLDICMQARKFSKIIVTPDILVKHFSGGSFQEEWKNYGAKFNAKYYNELPASCANSTPDPARRVSFDSFPLTSVFNQQASLCINNLGNVAHARTPAIANADKPLIIITGMHRSGTSCVAGLLHACGYSLGPEQNLLGGNRPKDDNEKGVFENGYVFLVNDAIMTKAGGSWHCLPSAKNVTDTGELFKSKIIKFSNEFSGELVKDPRLCITMPVWLKYCPRISHIILCLRHPLSVAHSLNKRNDFTLDTGLQLWYDYNSRLLNALDNRSLIVVDYDKLPDNPVGDVEKVLQRLGGNKKGKDLTEKVNSFYERKLDHNHREMSGQNTVPAHIEELYRQLQCMSVSQVNTRS